MAEAEMHIYGGDLPCHCRTLRHHLKLVLGDDTINRLDPYLDPLLSEVERLRGVVADAEEAKRAVLKWANTCDHVGCECDNTLADELPDDWMALAALEEG